MTSKRVPVGAHYGWRDWLVQRISAVVMALYDQLSVAFEVRNAELAPGSWPARFDLTLRASLEELDPHRAVLAAVLPVLLVVSLTEAPLKGGEIIYIQPVMRNWKIAWRAQI